VPQKAIQVIWWWEKRRLVDAALDAIEKTLRAKRL
jgi:hypothetical protein